MHQPHSTFSATLFIHKMQLTSASQVPLHELDMVKAQRKHHHDVKKCPIYVVVFFTWQEPNQE